jgi:acetate---CoA ligase (ADP-forming)
MKGVPQRIRVYRRADLQRVLHPRSIAIVGASARQGSFGERVLNNLVGYAGNVHLVNPKSDRIGDRLCHPNLSALPESPDCVVVCVPREGVEEVVLEAAKVRAGGAIVFASGYAETGKPERVAQQTRLSQLAAESGMRILGPNCLGIGNYALGARITFSEYPAVRPLRAASVGIASQSGALSQSLAQSIETGVCVSHSFSAGNQVDVDVADLVAYLAEEQTCRSIVCVFEGMSQPQRLLEAAELAWQNGKPLLIHKIATGQLGSEAAVSHTGTLAGSNAAYRAAFERAGAILLEDFEALMEAAAFFAKAPPPKARGVAVAATSGGAAIMAADKAEEHGVPMPQPSAAATAVLLQHIPDFGSARNPCDVTAQVVNNPQSLWACGEALLADEQYGALVMPQPVAFDFHTPRIAALGDLSNKHGKITCNVMVSQWLQGPGALEAEMNPYVAQFRSMDRCFAALAAWHAYHERRQAGPRDWRRASDTSAAKLAAARLENSHGSILAEREAKAVLASYGVPVVEERLVQAEVEAVAAAETLGYPVVLKVESPDLPHKTEAGVVRLGLKDAATVRQAYQSILANAHKASPAARITGVLVQPMIPSGVEIMVGARVDPQLGPLIVAGFGGIMVELLRDTSIELAPVTHAEARAMLRRLKGAKLLDGFRGSAPIDVDRLAQVICRLSEFAADQADRLAELDVNPLICSADGIVAVDALIALRPQTH